MLCLNRQPVDWVGILPSCAAWTLRKKTRIAWEMQTLLHFLAVTSSDESLCQELDSDKQSDATTWICDHKFGLFCSFPSLRHFSGPSSVIIYEVDPGLLGNV